MKSNFLKKKMVRERDIKEDEENLIDFNGNMTIEEEGDKENNNDIKEVKVEF